MMRNINGMGNQIKISLPKDENGLISRKCPNPSCGGIFKIKPGTGLKGNNLPCHCPYCGHKTAMNKFNTPEQIEYAKSIAVNKILNALGQDIQNWGRDLERSTRNSFLKMKVDYVSHPRPIRYYREKQLETKLICDSCSLEYAIYGVFAFCPDCGSHNSFQILNKNLELIEKEIVFAGTTNDSDLSKKLIEDALENAVSSIDGFGRAITAAYSTKASEEEKAKEITFQNIEGARVRIQSLFAFDLARDISADDWRFIVRCCQKRHLLAHTMGVIDEDYIKKAQDPEAILGRTIRISPDEVTMLVKLLREIGNSLAENLK
jgi:hypothetical protein